MHRPLAPLALALADLAPAAAAGTTVKATAHGTVAFNSITEAPFNLVSSGQAATLSFLLDGDSFVNSPGFPTRGDVIDQASFALAFPATSVARPSLDLLDAVGSHDFTGLTAFNGSVDDGPFNPLGIDFAVQHAVRAAGGHGPGAGRGRRLSPAAPGSPGSRS